MQLSNLWIILSIISAIIIVSKTMDFFWDLKSKIDEIHDMLKLQENNQIDLEYLESLKKRYNDSKLKPVEMKEQLERFEKYLEIKKVEKLTQVHKAYQTYFAREENESTNTL